ncbi:gonadotropin-releasing hormone receptor-like [Tropilaelaps mercedesae]|uniref:Gonadotropin-releasing hormone receptor-like n=1 Tax=Tropilaelaps mercedesae TaxID=418985 RepID=A0A1V9X5G8_9ACAR|nr:gonadotropin-releasing hormone receptor-like [Tropilaelaps mercedesae]
MNQSHMHPTGVEALQNLQLEDCASDIGATLCRSLLNGTLSGVSDAIILEKTDHLQAAPQVTQWVLVRVAILSFIGGASLLANAMALSSIFRMRQRRMLSYSSRLYTLLAHMAVADLLVTSFCIVAEAAWTYTVQWLADELMCKFIKYMQVFALYLSTFILLVLALDQLLTVRYPLRRDVNIVIIRKAVVAAWLCAAILSVPQVGIFTPSPDSPELVTAPDLLQDLRLPYARRAT